MRDDTHFVEATIGLPIDEEGRVILGVKADKVGKDLRNGCGGVFELGENKVECMLRELREEYGVGSDPSWLDDAGIVDFHNQKDGSIFTVRCYIFLIHDWIGEIGEFGRREMLDPKPFAVQELPFGKMLPADRIWLPPVLSHLRIYAEFWYAPGQKFMTRPWELRDLGPSAACLRRRRFV